MNMKYANWQQKVRKNQAAYMERLEARQAVDRARKAMNMRPVRERFVKQLWLCGLDLPMVEECEWEVDGFVMRMMEGGDRPNLYIGMRVPDVSAMGGHWNYYQRGYQCMVWREVAIWFEFGTNEEALLEAERVGAMIADALDELPEEAARQMEVNAAIVIEVREDDLSELEGANG